MTDATGKTGVQVTYGNLFKWWPWMWSFWFVGMIIPFLFDPKIIIDGESHDGVRDADKNFIPTSPGQHTVEAHYRQGFIKKAGRSSTTVNVTDGQVVQLKYRAPFLGINILKGALNPM